MAVRGSLAKAVLTTALLPTPVPADNGTAPLSTRGRRIVDADGDRFTLRPGNWRRTSGTWNGVGGTDADHHTGIPLGLDRAPMLESIAGFQESGINSVRRHTRAPRGGLSSRWEFPARLSAPESPRMTTPALCLTCGRR